jgi:hypothetical protein
MEIVRRNRKTNVKNTVVDNSQNVHDVGIRSEVAKAIIHLTKDKCKLNSKDALREFGEVIGAISVQNDDTYPFYESFFDKFKNLFTRNRRRKVINDITNNDDSRWRSDVSQDAEGDYLFIKSLYDRGGRCEESGVTFPKLFRYFWNRISMSENKDDILKTFVQNAIPEMRQVCFVGRISRIINCLSGYFDDIVIDIPIGEQIQMKYNIVSKRNKKYDYSPFLYNVICYYEFRDLLEELELSKETVNKWIYPYIEEIEEILEKHNQINDIKRKLPDGLMSRFDKDQQNDVFTT